MQGRLASAACNPVLGAFLPGEYFALSDVRHVLSMTRSGPGSSPGPGLGDAMWSNGLSGPGGNSTWPHPRGIVALPNLNGLRTST